MKQASRKRLRRARCSPASPPCSSSPSFAVADTAERETYKAAVEPICKSNKAAADRLLGPVKGLVKKDKLKPAGDGLLEGGDRTRKDAEEARRRPPAAERRGEADQVAV